MILLPPEPAPVTGVQAPTCRGEPAPIFSLFSFLLLFLA
jgi:hypothetical protein